MIIIRVRSHPTGFFGRGLAQFSIYAMLFNAVNAHYRSQLCSLCLEAKVIVRAKAVIYVDRNLENVYSFAF